MSKTYKKTFDFSIENLLRSDYHEEKSFKNQREENSYGELSKTMNNFSISAGASSKDYLDQFNESNNVHNSLPLPTGAESYEKSKGINQRVEDEKAENHETFSWLNCTRFKPPKLPRSRKRGTLGKRLGRGPRIPFSPHQIVILESTFTNSQYLSSECISRLANALHLSETRVKIWFQNRRARYRREKDTIPSGQYEIEGEQSKSCNNNKLFRKQRTSLVSAEHLLPFQFQLSGQDDQVSTILERSFNSKSNNFLKSGLFPLPFHRISHPHHQVQESLTFTDLRYLENNISNLRLPPIMVSTSTTAESSTTHTYSIHTS